MIVRQATDDDIRFAMANLSAWSRAEYEACAAPLGGLEALEVGLLRARPNLLALFAVCDDAGRPGFMMIVARAEMGQIELAGFTTKFFDAIHRPFWLWLMRDFREFVDRHCFRSTMSIATGHPRWHAALLRLGFVESSERETIGGREFVHLERIRPRAAVDRRGAALRSPSIDSHKAEVPR